MGTIGRRPSRVDGPAAEPPPSTVPAEPDPPGSPSSACTPAAERPAPRPAGRSSRRDLLDTGLVAGAVIAGALSTGWPENVLQWALLLAAAALGGLAPHSPLSDLVRTGSARLLRRMRSVRLRRLVVWFVVVLTAAGLGRTLVAVGPDAAGWAASRVFGCANPVELRLLSTPDGERAARELADAFERWAAADTHGCAAVNVYVHAQPAAVARNALMAGWSVNHLRTLGPRPDLWLPGSSQHALADPDRLTNGLLPEVRTIPVASTPVVLAVPMDAVPEALALRRTEVGWAEALAMAERPGWGLVRADPALSVAAELATVAIYASGVDPSRLAGPVSGTAGLITTGRARSVERRIAAGLDRHGYPLGDDADLLCRHRTLNSPPGALIITEQQLARFNSGRPLGADCPAAALARPTGKGLFAIYPADTLSLDFPLVRLGWPDRSRTQRGWTDRFEEWLRGESGRAALNDVGLRPPGWPLGEPLTETHGVLPGVWYPTVRPSDEILRHVRTVRAAAQRPGRVLLALDASGSMRERTGTDGKTRFAVAAAGVSRSLDRMSGRDEFGLWVFQGFGRPARPLVPLGPGDAPVDGEHRREAAARALRGVRPDGDTPLYRTVVDGVAALGSGPPDSVNALVVLTDGEDYGSGVSPAELLHAVRGGPVRVFVVAVGEASCGSRALREVTRVTAGGCVDATFGNLDVRLDELFRVLWGGS